MELRSPPRHVTTCHGEPWASNRGAAPCWWVAGRPPAGRVRSPGPRLAPPARAAQELKGPANAAPFCSPPHTVLVSLPPTRSISQYLLGDWGELSAASLPHPGKHRRSMRIEWRNGNGGRRTEMGMLGFACLFACLSAPALALYLVSMGLCWLGVRRRDSC
jgi:hypothetical protein